MKFVTKTKQNKTQRKPKRKQIVIKILETRNLKEQNFLNRKTITITKLYKMLQNHNFRSIGYLENKIKVTDSNIEMNAPFASFSS